LNDKYLKCIIKYMACNIISILFSFEMSCVTHYFSVICVAMMIRYPQPTSNFFSSNFVNSHDPAGLGLGHVPPLNDHPLAMLLNAE